MNRAEKIQILKDADLQLFNAPYKNYEETSDKDLDIEMMITLKMATRNLKFLSNRITALTGIKK